MLNISVIVNTLSVLLGSLIGVFIGKKLNDNLRIIMFEAVGIITLIMGIKMGLGASDFIVVLGALVAGGVIGQFIDIEGKIGKFANKIEKSEGETSFVKGFITATVLFTVGPMTILGCFEAGISGNNSLIFLKSLLDFFSSIILASLYRYGVVMAAGSVYIIQGLLISFSASLGFLADPIYLPDFTAVGGAVMVAIGVRLIEIKNIKAGNFLPSLGIVILINWIKNFFV